MVPASQMLLATNGKSTKAKLTTKQQDAERKKRETENTAFTGLFGGKARAQGVPS